MVCVCGVVNVIVVVLLCDADVMNADVIAIAVVFRNKISQESTVYSYML